MTWAPGGGGILDRFIAEGLQRDEPPPRLDPVLPKGGGGPVSALQPAQISSRSINSPQVEDEQPAEPGPIGLVGRELAAQGRESACSFVAGACQFHHDRRCGCGLPRWHTMGLNRMFKLVDQQQGSMVASPRPRQSLRRWGNSLGVRLPAAICREAGLQDNQTVELRVVAEGVLIRPVEPRLTLAERLAAFAPMEGEATEAMAWDPVGAEASE